MEPTRALDPTADDPEFGEGYLDTVALLQAEVDRLEAELRAWTEAATSADPMPARPEPDPEAERRIEELTAALNESDETIAMLWEHLSAVEQAHAARSAEWEQLHHWVEELERQLDEPGDHSQGLRLVPLDHDSREIEELRARFDDERSAWQRDRLGLEAEVARLRRAIEADGRPAEPADDRVAVLQAQLDHCREQLREAEETLDRERSQHRSEQSAMQAGPPSAPPAVSAADLTPSERIRALREHLREIHDHEEAERKQRQLSARIARLLGRSGGKR